MATSDRVFAGEIPDIYDEFLVPLIFESYAEDLAERVSSRSPQRVLETAAGSGVVPRALAPLLNEESSYTVTDLNAPMLERAKQRQKDADRISWQQADAQNLPFQDAEFDAVCCQFGVMFFPDRKLAFSEVHRVLEKGGCWIFSLWDRIERNAFADTVTQAVGEIFPQDPPVFLSRTPHGHFETGPIRAELLAAGFAHVDVATVARESVAASPQIPAVAYCQGTPLRTEIEARDPQALIEATDHSASCIEKKFGSGQVRGEIRAFVVSAYR